MAWKHGRGWIVLPALLAIACAGCGREGSADHKKMVAWRPVGSWSGHGDAQTDSFEIGYTDARIRWETRSQKAPAAGSFLLTVNSAVSGRELATVVNRMGAGRGLQYVSVDPHWAYLVISCKDLDWSVTLEEPTVVQAP